MKKKKEFLCNDGRKLPIHKVNAEAYLDEEGEIQFILPDTFINNNHLLMSNPVYPASWNLDRWRKEREIAIKHLKKTFKKTYHTWNEPEKTEEINKYFLTKYGKNGKFYTEE